MLRCTAFSPSLHEHLRAILRSRRQFGTLGPKGLTMATKSGISWEEFLAAGEEGQRWEYVDGEVEFMSPVYLRHQAMLCVLIASFVEYRKHHPEWLWFPGDATFTMASGNLRCPDLSIVHASRFPGGKVPDAKADFPPDIVFEIISSGDTASQMARKRKDYQESAVIQVWIDPQRRLVEVVCPDRPAQYIEELQLLVIDKLPGFSLDLNTVFSV
jgi:Uma2 family endonuclease